jgi:hypothetical protein
MFWIGFACGIAAAVVMLFVVVLWAMSLGDPFDDGEDEHAEIGGIGADHFGSVSK